MAHWDVAAGKSSRTRLSPAIKTRNDETGKDCENWGIVMVGSKSLPCPRHPGLSMDQLTGVADG